MAVLTGAYSTIYGGWTLGETPNSHSKT